MISRTEGLGRKSIEVVLSAGMSPGPIKIESLRDGTLIAFQAYRTTPSKHTTTKDGVITRAAEKLGYYNIHPNQHKAVKAFLEGNDVFLSLPTGSGKSLCYAILPLLLMTSTVARVAWRLLCLLLKTHAPLFLNVYMIC